MKTRIVQKFRFLIVSMAKICKHCLQTAKASGGRPHIIGAIGPQMKIPGAAVRVGYTSYLYLSCKALVLNRL